MSTSASLSSVSLGAHKGSQLEKAAVAAALTKVNKGARKKSVLNSSRNALSGLATPPPPYEVK